MKKGNKFSFMDWEDGREKGKIFKQKIKRQFIEEGEQTRTQPLS